MAVAESSLNFFEVLSQDESLDLIKYCIINRIKVLAVRENQIKTLNCYIHNHVSLSRLYITCTAEITELKKNYSFCIEANHRVYFFKGLLVQGKNGLYISEDLQIYELRRRKQARYNIPFHWNQSFLIYSNIKKNLKQRALILNLSLSGIRIVVESPQTAYVVNDRVQFSVQIHRRAEILCEGIVKYVKPNKTSGPMLGLEFLNITLSFENKIKNICDDLLRHHVIQLKNSYKHP